MERLLADAGKISGVKYDIDNLSDVYEAIHVIQTELDITGTTAKEAEQTLSGSFSALKSSLTNFLGDLTLGRNIEPAMKALAESASTFLFDNLMPALARIVVNLPGALLTFVQQGIPKLLVGIANFIPQFISQLTTMVYQVGARVVRLINEFGNNPGIASGGMTIIVNLVKGIITSLPALGVAVVHMQATLWKALGKLAINLIGKGKDMGVSLVKGMASGLKSRIANLISTIKSYFPIKLGNLFKNIKLPHFNLKWSSKDFGPLGNLKYPTGFNVNWYKTGGIFNNPSIVGIGEAGSEAVVPLTEFWNKIDSMSSDIVDGIGMQMRASALGGGGTTIALYAFPNGPKMDEWIVDSYNRGTRRGLK